MFVGRNSATFLFPVSLGALPLYHTRNIIISFISGQIFSEGSKFANIRLVRDSKQFQDNLVVQKAFGDICLGYQRHSRSKLELEKDQLHVDMQQQREKFEKEREMYETRVKESHMEMQKQREDFEKGREQYEMRVKEALQDLEKREAELKGEVEEERRKNNSLKADFDTDREGLKEKLRNAEQCE